MATTAGADSPITVLVHMKIQPPNTPRFTELCQELIADIEATEPAGNVKYHLFRNNSVENELTIIESFKSREVMEAWYKKAKHQEISSKAFEEGLIEEGWETRYCSRIGGTREWNGGRETEI